MKTAIIIWVLALVVGVSSLSYVNKQIDHIALNSRWAKSEPLQLAEAEEAGGLSFGDEKASVGAVNSSEMQVGTFPGEDSWTPTLALMETRHPQVTVNYAYIQNAISPVVYTQFPSKNGLVGDKVTLFGPTIHTNVLAKPVLQVY